MPELPGWQLERQLWAAGCGTTVGIDEAGRGCLAGPVTAGAVILPYAAKYPYRDSKQLDAARRSELAGRLKDEAVACSVGWASAQEIDRLGILRATHLAAARALEALGWPLMHCGLVTDYLRLEHAGPVLAEPRADSRSWQVAAASILAKTARDDLMRQLDSDHPGYGFARHKGYGTRAHLAALQELGPCSQHRLSFAPVARAMQKPREGLQCANEPADSRHQEVGAQERQ